MRIVFFVLVLFGCAPKTSDGWDVESYWAGKRSEIGEEAEERAQRRSACDRACDEDDEGACFNNDARGYAIRALAGQQTDEGVRRKMITQASGLYEHCAECRAQCMSICR